MKKLLIIRSSSIQQLDQNISEIEKKFKNHEIHILTHPHTLEHCKKYSVKKVISYNSKNDFSIFHFPKELKLTKYDSLIYLVSNLSGKGYLNLMLFSLLIRPKNIFFINIKSEIKRITKLSILKSISNSLLSFILTLITLPFIMIASIILMIVSIIKNK